MQQLRLARDDLDRRLVDAAAREADVSPYAARVIDDPRPEGLWPTNETGLVQARRQRDEYLNVCYSLEKQRDRWKAMFKQHSLEHMNALGLYDDAAIKHRRLLASAWTTLNKLRVASGLAPLTKLDELIEATELEAPPVGIARKYALSMMALYREAAKHDTVACQDIAEADARAASVPASPPGEQKSQEA